MPGWRTYNTTNKPVWVTIYTLGGVFKEDWGNVDPGQYRDWHSGNYALGSYYKIRGQWPTEGTKHDTDTTLGLYQPLSQVTLVGGDAGVSWSRPFVRTENATPYQVWITIYTEPGKNKKDWGDVYPNATRDWQGSGDYQSGEVITVLAEWSTAATKPNRDTQEAPPAEANSVKISRMFGEHGFAHLRLVWDGKTGCSWVNVNS